MGYFQSISYLYSATIRANPHDRYLLVTKQGNALINPYQGAMVKSSSAAGNENGPSSGSSKGVVGFRNRVKRTAGTNGSKRGAPQLSVDAAAIEAEHANGGQGQGSRGPMTPPGVRGHTDLRSPGAKLSPLNNGESHPGFAQCDDPAADDNAPIPDFITQTDRHGRATTPRSAEGIQTARQMHPSGPKPNLHVENGTLVNDEEREVAGGMDCQTEVDACDSLLDSLRMMCCCLLPEDENTAGGGDSKDGHNLTSPVGYSTRGHDAPLLLAEDSALNNANNPDKIKLLPELHLDDHGKKCLVLDLDETLVHSSFRAVPGADFVIPVQVSFLRLQLFSHIL